MNEASALSIIETVLILLEGVLGNLNTSGVLPEIVKDVESAINSLQKVSTTPVTKEQLEGLRLALRW